MRVETSFADSIASDVICKHAAHDDRSFEAMEVLLYIDSDIASF